MIFWPRISDYYDPLLQKSPSPKSHRKVTDRALRSRAGVCDFSVTFWRRISDYYDSLPRQIRRQKSTKCFKRGGRLGLLFVWGVFFVCVGLVNCSTCCCSPYFPERAAVESLTLLYFVTVPCFFEPPGRKDNPRNAASAPNRFDV